MPRLFILGTQWSFVFLELSFQHVKDRGLHKNHVLGLDFVQNVSSTKVFHEFGQFLVISTKHTKCLFNHLNDETGMNKKTLTIFDLFNLGRGRETKQWQRLGTFCEELFENHEPTNFVVILNVGKLTPVLVGDVLIGSRQTNIQRSLPLNHIRNEHRHDIFPSLFVGGSEFPSKHLLHHQNNRFRHEGEVFSFHAVRHVLLAKIKEVLSEFLIIFTKHGDGLSNHGQQEVGMLQKALVLQKLVRERINCLGESKQQLGFRTLVKDILEEKNSTLLLIVRDLCELFPALNDDKLLCSGKPFVDVTLTANHIGNKDSHDIFEGLLVFIGEFIAEHALEHDDNSISHVREIVRSDSKRHVFLTQLSQVLGQSFVVISKHLHSLFNHL
mmetsp:Transcript_28474/g.50443  ORF Transcript_28474/g.50443 Transcript_28474/m.50443 type:complete len:384 (+) Transcript_28474:291-1442(+)